ncbi:RelA/SpoT family protein [bacterium]|nr:RelA/SpoT family protein [bacterium]
MLELHSPSLTTPAEFMDYLLKEDRPNRDLKLVEKAAKFAFQAHTGQKRKSGEPYILHPFAVAIIIDQMKLDTASICGAIMHDVLEDCEVSKEELTEEFGTTVYHLVDGVTKLSKIKFGSKEELQAESLRKMLLAMTRDIRVIIIKICDRLHNMRTMEHMPKHKQMRISKETIDIYCPLAHRLGMSSIKWQLEDLCLKYTNPKAFYDILKRIAQKRKERESFIQTVISELKENLKDSSFEVEISGRPKSFYSIYLKSLKSPKYLDDMFDLIGLRILTKNKEQCYGILGVVHSMWTPLQNRFKDYIAVPKPNLYQSLHTTIFHPNGQRVEVQIRTFDMHETSEYGVAAHCHYKEGSNKALQKQEELKWLKEIVDWHSDIRDSQEFIENVKLDLFQHMVYAFTPNGKII